jgi:cellulose synthase (UDP-forming)
VFSGKEQGWHVTGAKGKRVSPFNFMIPQVLAFVFLLLTSVVGGVKDYGHQTLTLASAWNMTNTVVFAVFIIAAFRESHVTRRAVPARAQVYPTFGRSPVVNRRPQPAFSMDRANSMSVTDSMSMTGSTDRKVAS